MKLRFTGILLIFFQLQLMAQKPLLHKAWAGNDLEYIKIGSERVYFEVFGRYSDEKKYLIIGDTLRLYDKYTTSRDNYAKEHIKNFDFLIKELTVQHLTLMPLDSNAQELADHKLLLMYQDRSLLKAKQMDFKQLKFKGTTCLGTCPDMSLQIDSHKNLLFIGGRNAFKQGYYQGTLSNALYKQLIEILKSSALGQLKNWKQHVFDAPEYTIDISYNGQTKHLKQFQLPAVTNELINFLLELPQKVTLKESPTPFELHFLSN